MTFPSNLIGDKIWLCSIWPLNPEIRLRQSGKDVMLMTWWAGQRVTEDTEHRRIYKKTWIRLRKANTVYPQSWSLVPKRANVGETMTEKPVYQICHNFNQKWNFLSKSFFTEKFYFFFDLKTILVLYWGKSTAMSSMGRKGRERPPTYSNPLIWVLI